MYSHFSRSSGNPDNVNRVFHIRTEMPNVAYFELNWLKSKVILFYELILLHSEIIVFKMKN